MAIYTDRIVLVFPISAKNRQAAASLQTLEVTESGKEFENLVPLDPALVADYASEFNLGALGQVTTLESEKTQLTTDLATRTNERDALQSQVTALTSEKATLTTDLATRTTDLATRTTELATANATITALQTKIADLEQYRPYNPRILKGEAFYDRVSKEDMVTLLASDNPQLVEVGKTIEAYRFHKWPVILDSPEFAQLMGFVQLSGIFDQAEVDAVMVDASREEAYTA
jgi:hypothetical protein